MKKTSLVKEWIASWKAVWNKAWYLPASAVADILFLVVYGFMTAPVFAKLTDHVVVIGTLLSEQMRTVAGRARPAIIEALFQPPVSKYTWQFLALLLILALVLFAVFCVFQGIAWMLASRVSGKKIHWRVFLIKFARITILWAGLYFLWQCLDTVFDLRRIAIEKAMNMPAPGAGIVLSILLGVMLYFAAVSYPLLAIKKAFRTGINKAGVIVPAGVIIAAQLYIGNFITKKMAALNPKLAFIAGAIILLVLVGWSRLYITRVVRGCADV